MTTPSINQKSVERLNRIFKLQKEAYLKDQYPSADKRKELMGRVPGMLKKYRKLIHEALDADFGGHPSQSGDIFEILGMLDRAKFNMENVAKWMKPIKKAVNPVTAGRSKAYVKYHPKGVIGNMVSWNFPFDIAIGPMLDQLGAGNRVIIKSSDLSINCGNILQEMIADTYDEDQVAVTNGELEFAKYFPTLPWDHLIYTGSAKVGSLVMQAAAKNLVPVTLELGGKSPTIVHSNSISDDTIAKIAGVKAVKRGQVCVNTDYILVPEEKKNEFVDKLSKYMNTHFAKDNAVNSSCGIISDRHCLRLESLVEEARKSDVEVIQIGKDREGDQRDMPFYIVVEPSKNLQMMKEEIFGPIIPIITYKTTEDIIDFVNSDGHPLGLYIFSKDQQFIDQITNNTRSGGVAINTIALQAAQPSLPFGGVGGSGMGVHHGVEGFREFSNPRGYFVQGGGSTVNMIMPPFGKDTNHLIEEVALAPMAKQLKFAVKRLPKILFGK